MLPNFRLQLNKLKIKVLKSSCIFKISGLCNGYWLMCWLFFVSFIFRFLIAQTKFITNTIVEISIKVKVSRESEFRISSVMKDREIKIRCDIESFLFVQYLNNVKIPYPIRNPNHKNGLTMNIQKLKS